MPKIKCPSEDPAKLPRLCRLLGIDIPTTVEEQAVLTELVRIIFDVDEETWYAERPDTWAIVRRVRDRHSLEAEAAPWPAY
jgi:hypothetical protein